MNKHEIRVASDTVPRALTQAIAKLYRESANDLEGTELLLTCVGTRATALAVHCTAGANRLLFGENIELLLRPRMFERDDCQVTGLRLVARKIP